MFDFVLFSYDSVELEAMYLAYQNSKKTADEKTKLNTNKPILTKTKKQKKEYKMQIIVIDYNYVTGAKYRTVDIKPVSLNNTLRRYQQTIDAKRKMIAHQRTQHK